MTTKEITVTWVEVTHFERTFVLSSTDEDASMLDVEDLERLAQSIADLDSLEHSSCVTETSGPRFQKVTLT